MVQRKKSLFEEGGRLATSMKGCVNMSGRMTIERIDLKSGGGKKGWQRGTELFIEVLV